MVSTDLPCRFVPQLLGDRQRIDVQIDPPVHLVAGLVKLPMMGAAERDGVFVTDLLGHRLRLGKAKVMGVGRGPAADQAGLLGDELEVARVSAAARMLDQEPARAPRRSIPVGLIRLAPGRGFDRCGDPPDPTAGVSEANWGPSVLRPSTIRRRLFQACPQLCY